MEVFEAYVREYLDPLRPTQLRGKDSRNPFKVKEWRQENAHVDRRVDKLRRWLEQNPCARWASS
jgi:hypothetical protein